MAKTGETQESLARKIGVSSSTVSRWQNGSKPHKTKAHQLAGILQVTTSWLLTGEGEREPVNKETVERLFGPTRPDSKISDTGLNAHEIWREAFLDLAKINQVNVATGIDILARLQPPGYGPALQGLSALNLKNQSKESH